MFLGNYEIGDTVTFYAETHNPATGGISAPDGDVEYRVFEDEEGTPILSGVMDALGTAGNFFSGQIVLSAENGFEEGKAYSIRLVAKVGGISGSTHRYFQVKELTVALSPQGKSDVKAGVVAALDEDTYDLPGPGVPPATTSLRRMIGYLYKFLTNRSEQRKVSAALQRFYVYDRGGTRIEHTADCTDDGLTYTRDEIGTGSF